MLLVNTEGCTAIPASALNLSIHFFHAPDDRIQDQTLLPLQYVCPHQGKSSLALISWINYFVQAQSFQVTEEICEIQSEKLHVYYKKEGFNTLPV